MYADFIALSAAIRMSLKCVERMQANKYGISSRPSNLKNLDQAFGETFSPRTEFDVCASECSRIADCRRGELKTGRGRSSVDQMMSGSRRWVRMLYARNSGSFGVARGGSMIRASS